MSEGNQLWQNHRKALEASVWTSHSPFFSLTFHRPKQVSVVKPDTTGAGRVIKSGPARLGEASVTLLSN